MWENMNGLNTNVKLHSSCSSNRVVFFSAPDTWGSAQSSE